MRWDQICNETLVWNIPETKNGTPQRLPLCPEATAVLARRRRTQASPWVFPGIGVTGYMVEPKSGWQRVLGRAQALRLLHVVAERARWNDDKVRDLIERVLVSPARSAAALRAELRQLGVDAEQFEIRNLRFHDLRRTLGSWQARTGASLAIIGKSLNHKSPASTAVYARLDIDPVRAAIDKATAAMWRAGGIGG